MATRGPAPKPAKHGRTPNLDWTEVPDAPYPGPSPDLPRLPRRGRWHTMVEQWWGQVRTMPHCVLWRDVDWTFALETAYMKQAYWGLAEDGEATTSMAVEIRRREDLMGTTLESRRKLRIRYRPLDEDAAVEVDDDDLEVQVVEIPEAGGPGTVTPIGSRRARLTRSA